jgi:hypothetical protein
MESRMSPNLADEIAKRIKACGEEPDHTEGGILLPWKQRAELDLTRFLNDQACNIVDALRQCGPNEREAAGYANGYATAIETAAQLVEGRAGSGPYAENMGAHRILTSAAEAVRSLSATKEGLK